MAFATAENVADRLALTFTSAQTAQCEVILDQVTGLIASACDKDDDWADDLTPIPVALAAFTIEKTAAAMAAPLGVRSESEQLGAHSHSVSYQDAVTGTVELTEAEELKVRRIVYGSNSATARMSSVVDDVYEFPS